MFEFAGGGALTRVARFTERGVGHAERLVWQELAASGVEAHQVTRIYSELEPCSIPGGYCAAWIEQTFPNATVTWSFEYGTTASSRAAGVDALREALDGLR